MSFFECQYLRKMPNFELSLPSNKLSLRISPHPTNHFASKPSGDYCYRRTAASIAVQKESSKFGETTAKRQERNECLPVLEIKNYI